MQSVSAVYNTGHETYAALAHSERLLLWACRTWAAWVGAGHCPLCPIEHEFGPLGIADAASALHALMCTTATSATRAFEVHGPGCQHISGDEIRLLRAAAAANRVNSNPRLLTCRSGCRLLKPTWRSSHCVLSLRLSRASG
jgi:hypothetical protein